MGASAAMLWGVVCLMMLPYPELVAQSDGGSGRVLAITGALSAFTVIAGVAVSLLVRRHAWRWAGQVLLALAVIALAVFAWRLP